MVYINEWFPNPIGNDAKGEFVELFNTSDTGVRLNGWALWTGGKSKKVFLNGFSIPAHGYLILKKPEIKLSLKNSDGGLWLYGPSGTVLDHGAFIGLALEGESFSRVNYSSADVQHFVFVAPTPGMANVMIDDQVTVRHYPLNTPLNPALNTIQFLGLLVGAVFTLIGVWAYIIYKNEKISKFVFRKNAGAR
jgi:hypothetical protein